jgi:transposase
MNVEVFENIIFSEYKAKTFLKKNCWKKGHVFCIRCHGYKIYRTAEKRYRCKRCGYTFHDFTGRWINNLNINYKQWLWILKFFELDLSTKKISEQMDLSYPTVLKACNIIRASIAVNSPGGVKADAVPETAGEEEGQDEGGGEEPDQIPVYGIREVDGKIEIEFIKGLSAGELLKKDVKMIREGSIVFTDPVDTYDSMIFCGYNSIKAEHKRRFTSGNVRISKVGGFWSYAKEKLGKFRGISKEYFPFYLKEIEFRYNYRNAEIFDILAKNLCQLVPNN